MRTKISTTYGQISPDSCFLFFLLFPIVAAAEKWWKEVETQQSKKHPSWNSLMTPEFLSVAWVLIILCIQLTIGIHHVRVLPVSLGIFQGWCALFICKIGETSLHMLLHLCRHITALVCQSGKNKILFIMCKENMTDTENSRVWKRWSRAHTKEFWMTE